MFCLDLMFETFLLFYSPEQGDINYFKRKFSTKINYKKRIQRHSTNLLNINFTKNVFFVISLIRVEVNTI